MANNALIVGISNYPQLPLPGADNDVKEWKALVEGSPFNFTTDILPNEKATKAEIEKRFRKMLRDSVANDQLLFFMSSHGTKILYNGKPAPGLIAYANGSPTAANVIFDAEFRKWIADDLKNGVELTFVLDACNAPGPEFEGFRLKFSGIQSPSTDELERILGGISDLGFFRTTEASSDEPLVLRATDEDSPAYEYKGPDGNYHGLFCNILAGIVLANSSVKHKDAMNDADFDVEQIRPNQHPNIDGPRQQNEFLT